MVETLKAETKYNLTKKNNINQSINLKKNKLKEEYKNERNNLKHYQNL